VRPSLNNGWLVLMPAENKGSKPAQTLRGADAGAGRAETRYRFGDQFGAHLEDIYREVLQQPIPERFIDLLKKLDAEGDGAREPDDE
jgi:hypothetical protein